MKNLLNPKWLLVVNTLPIILLYLLLASDFNVIKSQLDEENLQLWWNFGMALGILFVINLALTAYWMFRKLNVPGYYAFFCLVAYIVYIYFYVFNMDGLIPWSISRWMLTGNIAIYACTFLMPTLAYSMFALVVHLTSNPASRRAWVNFLIMVSIPVLVYLFFFVVLPLWDGAYYYSNDHVLLIFCIVCTVLFLFFLVRAIYILVSKRKKSWKKFELLWKIPIGLLLPLLGLFINSGVPFHHSFYLGRNIFGDLGNEWFFILAIVNGLLICMPDLKDQTYRLGLFIARSITMSFSFYFFIVFLPYLPFSILAIILVGVGFLMLTPLLLFMIHANELYTDFNFLKEFHTKRKLKVIMIIGFAVIPVAITVSFFLDRLALNEALQYVYKADYEKEYKVNKSNFASAIYNINKQKDAHNDILFFDYTPYLSSYYKWLVLDNLTLSDTKIGLLQNIFLGTSQNRPNAEGRNDRSDTPTVQSAEVESLYDSEQEAWHSWVHLEIENSSEGWGNDEFKTLIELPDGCWVSDYYLYVEDRKEMGILAEKKAALWVYSQIRDENKDPGIIHYEKGNQISFKVFPFAAGEVRRTGIEFLHKEPVTITIDDHRLTLGNVKDQVVGQKVETTGYATYVSAIDKKLLKPTKRKATFHFLIDVSENGKDHIDEFIDNVASQMDRYPDLAQDAKVSLLGTYMKTYNATDDWRTACKQAEFEGGCFYDRGIKTALYHAWKENTYPVIVILTADSDLTAMEENYADFKFIYPEYDDFYVIDQYDEMYAHSLRERSYQSRMSDVKEIYTGFDALEYKHSDGTVSYVRNDTLPSVIFRKPAFDIQQASLKKRNFQTAMMLQANWWSQLLYPEKADKEWLKLANYSFASQILTPVTSYIVVENEAQKEAMFRKQREVLSSDKDFDTQTNMSSRMSEPDLIILMVLLGAFALIRYRSHRRKLLLK